MKREEFEELAEAKAPPTLRNSDQLKAAIYDFVKHGGAFYHSDVGNVLREAEERREQAETPQEKAAPRQSPRPKPGAEAHFVSRMLVEGLKPWVENLREEGGLGSTVPPYPGDGGAAAEYIEETSAADLARWNKSWKDREEEHERINQLAHRLGLDVTTKVRLLPYSRPGDHHRKNAPTAPDTFLFNLAGEVAGVSRKTGLPPEALTMYVFTGGMPLLPRTWVAKRENHTLLPNGEQAHLRSVTLTFRTADLTFEELRTLYDDIKTYMGGKGIQAPTAEDLEFWELVQEAGGPPEPYRGAREFWREVLKEWNQKHPYDTPLKSWEGLQKKYRRLCKRLGIE